MPFSIRPSRRFPVHCAVTLPNEQRIVVPEVVVRWSRRQEFQALTGDGSGDTSLCKRGETKAYTFKQVRSLITAKT